MNPDLLTAIMDQHKARLKLADDLFYASLASLVDTREVTRKAVAEHYGITRETVRVWVKKGRAVIG